MIVDVLPIPHVVPLPLAPGATAPGFGDDRPLATGSPDTQSLGFSTLLDALNAGGAALAKAEAAENAFAAGTGGLQQMVFERAKADSIVSVAAAASSRVAQSLNTIAQIQL